MQMISAELLEHYRRCEAEGGGEEGLMRSDDVRDHGASMPILRYGSASPTEGRDERPSPNSRGAEKAIALMGDLLVYAKCDAEPKAMIGGASRPSIGCKRLICSLCSAAE